ncbi:C-terminal domain of CHU protein family protein [Fodinibius roseus]|uniref:C-terminal domain of CHU protein family protein n=1 Tax=Fodinibius roseus TaxID=1194090 RepID=A0A1M4Y9S1_9BACT|nr:lamin tail domain-containing protein [Fodinibius roseus]SHF02399.1 C-terminal domain of CHU protein family protein [Fodinibius roseus]
MTISSRSLWWLVLLFSLGTVTESHSQSIYLKDDFEDGNITSDPAWSGDDSLFTIASETENNLLRLEGNDGSDPACLSVPSTAVNGSWEWYLRLDFAPSANNRADIFLLSDRADLSGPVNGYALRAGENGSDDVFRIVRYEGGVEAETVLSGTTDISSGGSFRVRATRQAGGIWSLEVGEGYDGPLNPEGGTAPDNTFASTSFFGIRSTYTSTRADRFFFDDVTITEFPITVSKLNIQSNRQFEVLFTRAINPAGAGVADFSIDNGVGPPDSISIRDNAVTLFYPDPLPGGSYLLSVNNVEDQSGNTIDPDAVISFSLFDPFEPGDIIINEFMFDPPDELPEFVEVKNLSNKSLNLQDWRITDETNGTIFSADTLVLPPNAFLVISSDTATLASVFGNQRYVEHNHPALNNSGDTIQLITGEGEVADSLSYTPGWGGSGVALERRSASTPGIYRENWGDSPGGRSGTPGEPNNVPADETGPVLTELTILSSTMIKLGFDERLDLSTASDPANYGLSGKNVPSVTVTAPDSVELELDDPLQNAQSHTLAISNIEDIFSNVMAAGDTTFTYYEISSADSGDIFITEFNYNPASGETEYIEIYNPTNHSFDPSNWTLSDNRGIATSIASEEWLLPPESYAVLAPDNTLLKTDPDIQLLALGPSFPALNNSGDEIVLKNREGMVLDSLQYTAEWGGDENERALERKTTKVAGTFKENWGPAPRDSGSPGRPNTIPEDQTPPEMLELQPLNESQLQLVFSEHVEAADASAFQNYRISPNRNLQQVSVQSDTVTLFLSRAMTSGETYTLTVSGIPDIFGNSGGSSSHQIEYLRFEKAGAGDMVINEIMAAPGRETAEFVELYNRSAKNIDLSGWSLSDGIDAGFIPPDTRLRAHSYLILTGSASFAQKYEMAVALTAFPTLNNSGEALVLKNKPGSTIDSLHYQASWMGKAEGYSLERKDPLAASGDPSNWQSNLSADGHSAGIRNMNFEEDDVPPRVVFANNPGDDRIKIQFNEFIRRTDNLQFILNGAPLAVSSFDSARGHQIFLQAPAEGTNSAAQTITIENLTDVRGNMTPSSEIPVARSLQAGDLVINEIMFLPFANDNDMQADQGEYVELYNTRDYALSLEGLLMHDAPDENGRVRELQPVTTTAQWVLPRETVLIYADPAPAFAQSRVATFFDMDPPRLEAILRVDRGSLSLASEDAVYIADSTGTTIDYVHYSETWHNPNLVDSRGIALERITPGGMSNSGENWGSSVHPKGGTPGAGNSLYQEHPEQPKKTGISFSPNPFSPDGDGYEDNLVVSYTLDQSDYLLRVNIFDRYGRHIKELADGKPAGFEGTLSWDGRRDDGRRNRIGIYIIVFEAYDSASGSDKAFKKTVVLARKLN